MSAASFRASADSTSASSELGCASPGRSSSTPSAGPSSPGTSPTPLGSRTCERSERASSSRSISSAAASPARTSVVPAKEPGSTAPTRVFGPSTPGSFASFDPDTSSWRTCPPSSRGRGSAGTGGRSGEFSETWPKHGMTRSGRACRLESSGHPTCESGSGSWPTPHGMPKPGAAAESGAERQRARPGGQRSRAEELAHPEGEPERPGLRPEEPEGERRRRPGDGGRAGGTAKDPRRPVDNPDRGGHRAPQAEVCPGRDGALGAGWWATEPNVGRVADGVPHRVERLAALGNALVPQIAEWIGLRILQHERAAGREPVS